MNRREFQNVSNDNDKEAHPGLVITAVFLGLLAAATKGYLVRTDVEKRIESILPSLPPLECGKNQGGYCGLLKNEHP